MNDCHEYAALLDAFLDGELSPEEMGGVQSHLETCPACRAYVDDGLAMRAAFPDPEDQAVPGGFALRVMEAVRNAPRDGAPQGGTPRAGKQKYFPWVRVLAPMAACFAAVLVLRYALPGGSLNGASLPPAAGSDGGTPQAASAEPESASGQTGPAEEAVPYAYAASDAEDKADSARTKSIPSSAPPAETEWDAAADVPESLLPAPENSREEFQAIRIETAVPADQADLLAEYPARTDGDGTVWYTLTGEEYRLLAAALESRGVTAELPAGDVQDGDTVLVRAAER